MTSVGERPVLSLRDTLAGCPDCNYDLRGSEETRCPECGRVLSLRLRVAERRAHSTSTLTCCCVGVIVGSCASSLAVLASLRLVVQATASLVWPLGLGAATVTAVPVAFLMVNRQEEGERLLYRVLTAVIAGIISALSALGTLKYAFDHLAFVVV
jgi:membrane-associated HD superfamily phosphohydrolase